MKRYKCLKHFGWSRAPIKGNIYNEDHTWGDGAYTVGYYAEMDPSEWELVKSLYYLRDGVLRLLKKQEKI